MRRFLKTAYAQGTVLWHRAYGGEVLYTGGTRSPRTGSRGSERVSSPGGPPRSPDVSDEARDRGRLGVGIVASWVTIEVAVHPGIRCRETGSAPGVDRFPG